MEKVQWNSNNKNKMDLNNRKMTNHPPSPDIFYNKIQTFQYIRSLNIKSLSLYIDIASNN